MKESEFVTVGFDPGGKGKKGDNGNFGWAILHWTKFGKATHQSNEDHGVCTDARNAFEAVQKRLQSEKPVAVGIDAPLFWTENPLARNADDIVKMAGGGGSVLSINSLCGACLVQGVLVAHLIRKTWRQMEVTETHPVAMWKCLIADHNNKSELEDLLGGDYFERMIKRVKDPRNEESRRSDPRDHMIDAILSAYAAKKGPGWHDLACDEAEESGDNWFYPWTSSDHLHYWFPIPTNTNKRC